jgi:hypothetical protein
MKIIFYQANQTVPFLDLYKPLGSFDKLFFSNGISKLDKSQVRLLLPDNLQEDDSIFLVPVTWEKEFYAILHKKFSDIKWQKEHNPRKPSKEEIGTGWDEKLAQFYEEEVQVKWFNIFKFKKKEDKFVNLKELQEAVDTTTQEDNGVSGIVIIDNDTGEAIMRSQQRGADGQIDLSGVEDSITKLVNLKKEWTTGMISSLKKELEDLEHFLISFKKGELIVTFVPDHSVTIVFVNLEPTKSGPARKTAKTFTIGITQFL